jgi:hypothetical protein
MLIIKVISVVSLVGSVAWLIHSPGYEPVIATLTAASATIAAFVVDKKRDLRASMSQSVGSGGFGIQAGGNITTGDVQSNDQER